MMRKVDGRLRIVAVVFAAALMLLLVVLTGTSCGSGKKADSSDSSSSKLPPGTTEESISSTSTTAAGTLPDSDDTGSGTEEATTRTAASSSTPMVALDLAGARFTLASAERKSSNEDVVSGDNREINGDYMELELQVENVGTDLIDLSDFSFRLYSPGIEADEYYDYYGDTGTYGKYIASHTISASLLDYASLSGVNYLMKIGETVDDLFLFYDLNPNSTQLNTSVTKDNSKLIIKKISGSDYGDYIEMGLIGYPDE
ncbi:MAG: hypothetical protein JXA49_03775 [Actinobacteria bacterium]|nr:hypothetical protein [Actinomycetota bacterium]